MLESEVLNIFIIDIAHVLEGEEVADRLQYFLSDRHLVYGLLCELYVCRLMYALCLVIDPTALRCGATVYVWERKNCSVSARTNGRTTEEERHQRTEAQARHTSDCCTRLLVGFSFVWFVLFMFRVSMCVVTQRGLSKAGVHCEVDQKSSHTERNKQHRQDQQHINKQTRLGERGAESQPTVETHERRLDQEIPARVSLHSLTLQEYIHLHSVPSPCFILFVCVFSCFPFLLFRFCFVCCCDWQLAATRCQQQQRRIS